MIIPNWVFVAWLLDRREQYKPSSGTYAAFDELVKLAADNAPIEAWKHGELDDLRDWAKEIISKRGRAAAKSGGGA